MYMKAELEHPIEFIHPNFGTIQTSTVSISGRLFWRFFKLRQMLPQEVYVLNPDKPQKILAIGFLYKGKVKKGEQGKFEIIRTKE